MGDTKIILECFGTTSQCDEFKCPVWKECEEIAKTYRDEESATHTGAKS